MFKIHFFDPSTDTKLKKSEVLKYTNYFIIGELKQFFDKYHFYDMCGWNRKNVYMFGVPREDDSIVVKIKNISLTEINLYIWFDEIHNKNK